MKTAVVLLNMGGPNNLGEVELFLRNMFTDPNIITTKSAFLRNFIATMITFFRTEKAQDIYLELGGKSPIVDLTKKLVSALEEELGGEVYVDFAMRYTPPFADEVIARLEEREIEKVCLLPLYPHYSSTTTKSSLEDFEQKFHDSFLQASLCEIKSFFKHPTYNRAVIEEIRRVMEDARCEDFDLVFSAHGLPQKIVDAGDLYQEHVELHVKLLSKALEQERMHFREVHLAYQSKVGPMRWLEPSLEQKLQRLRNRRVVIYPIAFIVDNSETLYELDVEYREVAQELGFSEYRVCRCVNDSPLFVTALREMFESL